MAITPAKRKAMEEMVYQTFQKLDPTGRNTKMYQDLFKDMSDTQFDNFFKELFADENAYLTLNVIDYEIDLKIDDIENAAAYLKVPLFEKVAFPHFTMDKKNVIVTKERVPVGYVHVKRTQQTVAKKNGLSTSADIRSSITGQVTGKDRNGRESDLENSMFISLGMKDALKELNGPRSDDFAMKEQMYNAINTKGYVSMNDMESDPSNKTTLNTVNVFLLGMGINSDLVTKGLMTKQTVENEVKGR